MTEYDPEHEEQWEGEPDDEVIGRAFRWSLLVILLLGGLVALVIYLVNRPDPPPQATEGALVLPEVSRDSVEVPAFPFRDITAEAGIDFVHANGGYGAKLLPETMGGGCAFFDADQDGDPDLVFVNGNHWPWHPSTGPSPTMAFYRNDGTGSFRDQTREVGLDVSFYGMGVAVGDFDGDGRQDLFFTAVGSNRLFRNTETGFVDVTDAAGVAGDPEAWSSSSGFFDYDRDGDLDLFVCNYIRWSKEIDLAIDFQLTGVGRAYGPPTNFEGAHSYLYRNEGDGSFVDVSEAAGIQVPNPATGKPMGKALALVPVDFDGDGWLDVLVANDTVQNFSFHNQGDGSFREVGSDIGVAFDRNGNATGAMGIDAAFYRNDGELGVAIGNFANEMTSLYVGQGAAFQFADEAIGEGIGPKSRAALSFGLVFFDPDLDGRQDILQANGHLEEEINTVQVSQHYRQPAQLFWNTGQGRTFELAEDIGDLGKPVVGRGVAVADIDADGDYDVLLTQIAGPPLLLRNDQSTGHHWLRCRLSAPGGNPNGIGSLVEVSAGGIVQRLQVMPTRSYLSQVPAVTQFGLGDAASVDYVRVTWPDGQVQEVSGVQPDREILVRRDRP